MRPISFTAFPVIFLLLGVSIQAADRPENTAGKQADSLDKPVRLVFKLIPEEEENNMFSVLCAGGKYVIRTEGGGEDAGGAPPRTVVRPVGHTVLGWL